eukprot:4628213-Alexandrium_andersonii.AAC.1
MTFRTRRCGPLSCSSRPGPRSCCPFACPCRPPRQSPVARGCPWAACRWHSEVSPAPGTSGNSG